MHEFEKLFLIKQNPADGNCLFWAVAEFVEEWDHKQLRRLLGQFYASLDKNAEVSDDSLHARLLMQMTSDNIDYHAITHKELKKKHEVRICKNLVYAGIMDVIAFAYLLKRPVELYQKQQFGENSEHTPRMSIDVFEDASAHGKPPIRLFFNGTDHFEALLLR